MQQFFSWCAKNWTTMAVVLSFVVQIAPIKWNPWTAIFRWVGKVLTTDVSKQVSEIKKMQQEQQDAIDENEKDRIRWEVLDFANSCRNGRKHTKDEFQHIISLNDKYGRLLKKTGDKNGVFEAEYEYIKTLYAERQKKNDFL